jgi:hypothetical protein
VPTASASQARHRSPGGGPLKIHRKRGTTKNAEHQPGVFSIVF